MHDVHIHRRTLLASAFALLGTPALAQGDAWPNKPIRLVAPGAAGDGVDIFARMLAGPLQDALKQSVFVENKVGANSVIGNDFVAKAAPDGYTMLLSPSSAIAINPIVLPKMPYDTQKDLLPVAQVGASGVLLMANPASGFKNLADMVRHARANPGKLSYGTWGNGSTGHLAMEGIKAHYGLDMPHVPYKGTATELNDLLANNISVGFLDIASPVPHIKAGKLVALGVTGTGRGPALQDVPTLTEQGYKFDVNGWYGVFVPAKTPPAIVARLNQEINRILAMDETQKKFATLNMPKPPIKTAEQFAATVTSDIATWQGLAKTAKLTNE
jgi:tripartite-type tricarboxylate transporter receptor subunit TctC